jgi:hypothetical protein
MDMVDMNYAELEIAVFYHQDQYHVDMRFQAGEDCSALMLARCVPLSIDWAALLDATPDMERYGGRALWASDDTPGLEPRPQLYRKLRNTAAGTAAA